MPLVPLTDIDAMDRCLSAPGMVSFSDHDSNGVGDDDVIAECITYATAFVAGFLAQRYKAAVLASSPVIREIATIIACRTLCTRRGNPVPEPLEMRYQEIIEHGSLLASIAKGNPKLIDSDGAVLPGIAGGSPTFSNLTVDRLYTQEQIRVRQGSSSNQSTRIERDTAREWSNG